MDKIERERNFHNEELAKDGRKVIGKYYSITKSSRQSYLQFIEEYSVDGKTLEYGCGPGSSAFFLSRKKREVVGIDISEVAIKLAKETAHRENLNINFQIMNAENLTFAAHSFNLVCGSGILHHLDLHKAYKEISRVLSPDGCAVFLEPLGHNPLINIYRGITPKLRTADEHPLLMADLRLAEDYFQDVRFYCFHLLSLMAVPFRTMPGFHKFLNVLDKSDAYLFKKFPFLQKYAWTTVVSLREPKNN